MMQGRRDFLKGSIVAAGVSLAGTAARAQAAGKFPPGLIYTKEAPGRWAGKEGTHVPKATLEAGVLKVVTPHGMSEKHYIVKHTVTTPDGKLIGEKTFAPTDAAAGSSFPLPDGFKGALWVTSFCNIHDLWLAEFTV
jgi:superoxide reductase